MRPSGPSEPVTAPAPHAGLLSRLHPTPPLPLTGEFAAGLGPLLTAVADQIGGVLRSRRARWVIDRIGDRYTLTVSPEGISSKGLLRTRTVRWSDATAVELEPLTVLVARRVIAGTATSMAGRVVRIPGLRWLIRKVLGLIGDVLADATGKVTPESVPSTLVAVRSPDGDGIELDGPLALTSALSRGITAAAVSEATDRDIPVRRL
jgi:hypothetical protein